jgi:SAM-dependent methyltransferase
LETFDTSRLIGGSQQTALRVLLQAVIQWTADSLFSGRNTLVKTLMSASAFLGEWRDMVQPYHKYVYDLENRRILQRWEDCYKAEIEEGFDGWHQDDTRHSYRTLSLAILQDYNFNSILDLGCGKGTLTHAFKKKNNQVLGVDVSETAIRTARARYPDLLFHVTDLSQTIAVERLYTSLSNNVDLTICSNIIHLLANWSELLFSISKHSSFFLVSIYSPPESIAHIKSWEGLKIELDRNFSFVELIQIPLKHYYIALLKSKNKPSVSHFGDQYEMFLELSTAN